MLELFYTFSGQNQKLFLLINHATNLNMLPQILQFISWPFCISNFAVYYAVACLYFYFQIKKTSDLAVRQSSFHNIYNKMIKIGIIYVSFGLIYASLKFGIKLPRPFCSLTQKSFYTIAHVKKERCLSSFPSAHTGLAILIAYFLIPYLTLTNKITACLIVILVAISRITLAMHYPADIFYSFFIAWLVIIIGNIIYKLFKDNLIRSGENALAKFIV